MKHIVMLALVLLLIGLPVGTGSRMAGPAAAAPAGGGWQVFPSYNTSSLYALDMVSAADGWAGGTSGLSIHFDGTAWSSVETAFQFVFTAMDMVDSSYGWATTYQGRLVSYNGAQWVSGPKVADSSLTGLSMLDGANGWAVGYLGGIYRFSGGTWFEQSKVNYLLQGIDMVSANDGWAVGRTGATLRWNGSNWIPYGTPQNVWLMDVDMVSDSDGWAVGSDGVIWHWNGTAWTNWASPTTSTLRGVHMVDAANGWAVGEDGVIVHYNGTDWQVVPSPVSTSLHAVDMVSADEGWIVGAGGVILHYTPPTDAYDLSASSKILSERYPAVGETVVSTITIRNTGTMVAPDVQVFNATPLYTDYMGAATTTQGTIDSEDPLSVSLGDLAAGATATVTFQFKIQERSLPCWFVVDQAVISSEQMSVTRQAIATVGTASTIYLPLVSKSASMH